MSCFKVLPRAAVTAMLSAALLAMLAQTAGARPEEANDEARPSGRRAESGTTPRVNAGALPAAPPGLAHDQGGHRAEREPPRPPAAPMVPVPTRPSYRVADRHDGRDWHGPQGHAWPAPGVVVRVAPPGSRLVPWGGTRYHYHDGSWYAPHRQGWVVVQPPFGVVVRELPLWRSVVVVGGVGYFVANGIYYREIADGYQVVAPPGNLAPLNNVSGDDGGRSDALPRQFVYPRAGQSAQQQASDEYECHRWAVGQTGFDPSAVAASGVNAGDWSKRDNYLRARGACLEGRGYTVR